MTCSLEQMRLESTELARALNNAELIEEVKGGIERVNQAALTLV